MGFINSLQLVNKYPDDELQRWAYVPAQDLLLFWPWTEAIHAAKLYEHRLDWHDPYWYGGYVAPSTGEMSMSQGNFNNADWVEQRVRAELPKTSAVKELCPQCKHELVYVDKTQICPNCGWIPIGETDEFDPEEYLHERHFPEYRNDEMPNYLSTVVNLPNEFEPHAHDDDTRRTFIYLVPNDTIYIAPNNAYHNDMFYWLHKHVPEAIQQAQAGHDQMALGFIERSYEDHALECRMYYAEGLPRLPGHIMHELEQQFGESVYQSDWQYPVDWTKMEGDPFGDYDGEPTKQWPEGWSQEEGLVPSSGVIASFLKVAADVNALAAKAYDQIMARPDVAKIYDLAKIWEDKYQSGRAPGEPAKNMNMIMDVNKITDPSPDAHELVAAHNAHIAASAIQNTIARMRNNYPGAYKLMPNAVKTIKTRIANGLNVPTDEANHIADIYGGAGELLTQLRQENRIPQGMDINQMDFAQVEDWLYNFNRNEDDTGQYKTNDVVYDLGNGWHIVQIKDDDDLHVEGELMGHCVGTYCRQVSIGSSLIYSLRDPKNEPHATIEISGQNNGNVPPLAPYKEGPFSEGGADPWQVVQIQGKSNQEPIPQYKQMIKQWFEYLQDHEGVQFEPLHNTDMTEYIQDAYELMDWYHDIGQHPIQETTTERDEYGLPLTDGAAKYDNGNGYEFEWSTLVTYLIDNCLPREMQKYRHDNIFQSEELALALATAVKRAAPNEMMNIIQMAESELLEVEEGIDENNLDYYYETAVHVWQYHHPDEPIDQESEEFQGYQDEARDELYAEYFSKANDFVNEFVQAMKGTPAFHSKVTTGRVIYV